MENRNKIRWINKNVKAQEVLALSTWVNDNTVVRRLRMCKRFNDFDYRNTVAKWVRMLVSHENIYACKGMGATIFP